MSNLLGMMWTGVSGINAANTGISVTGNNIANMKTENYSRQVVALETKKPHYTGVGPVGTGVDVTSITRVYDDLLAKSVRNADSSYNYYDTMSNTLKSAMLYFNELELGSGLGDALVAYFNAWQDLSNTAPDNASESLTKRTVLVEAAQTLAIRINESYQSLEDVRTNCDKVIKNEVDAINEITTQIAVLNRQIVANEAMGQMANELRDERDGLLDSLSKKVQISSYLRENGEIAVFMNGETLVDGWTAYNLETEPDPENNDHYKVLWRTNGQFAKPTDMTSLFKNGTIAANLKVRDENIVNYMNDLDSLAKQIIEETNRIHTTGIGLDRATEYHGSTQVINPEYPLNSIYGELPYEVKTGSFTINIQSPTGTKDLDGNDEYETRRVTVQIEASDNLKYVLSQINELGGSYVNASINLDNTISIKAAAGCYISFSDDTTDFLMAAGMNSFFSGSGAADIEVYSNIVENPRLISASEFGAEGDNTNALKIAKMQTTSFKTSKGNASFKTFYGYFIGIMTSDKAKSDTFLTTTKMSYTELSTQLMSVRGVSQEEEEVNLSLYQRMFEANSRFVNVVDEMLNSLINGLGTVGR